MIRWLLDTNVISETRKLHVNPSVKAWLDKLHVEQLCTSAVNIAELHFGANLQPDPLKQVEIRAWIENDVRTWFLGRIFDVNEMVLLRWRIMTEQNQKQRKPNPPFDMLIAAVAQENGLYVATRDAAPFAASDVPVLNPFTGERFNGA